MKNSSKLLGLGLVLFLGACSAAEGDFLKKVEGKTAFFDAAHTEEFAKFSADGKSFGADPAATFVEATDDSTATYSLTIPADGTDPAQKIVVTITTADGVTGTMTQSDGTDTSDALPIWLK